ncbi:unnamed protein product [Triticum turgidum subsp. durum]|uniref:Tr-type G domain-containing protein n=1 Tax=Triticum turgidum subsp. durum TaxID=4567 RepID=A0A9R0YMI3_TRITD|nr:unnamed protein product [Triticum turgidum subsp. durum]
MTVQGASSQATRRDVRNIAIVAHVDHGKTTLVDSMLRQSKVDSVEGPMPQTRFVLKKALEFGHAVVVVVNKVDRPIARPEFVVNSTFELFIELNATDEQCDFQTVYAIGLKGKAGISADNLADDLGPLFEAILRCIPEPRIEKDGALQMLVTSTEYDEHKGRIAIGRLHAGELKRGMEVKAYCSPENAYFSLWLSIPCWRMPNYLFLTGVVNSSPKDYHSVLI